MERHIDTHIHIIPPSFRAAIEAAGGDPSGWALPSWSVPEALNALGVLGVEKAVFSVTAPGPKIAGAGKQGRDLCRTINEECLEIMRDNAGRFRYFASTPDWDDVEGVLEEVGWALEQDYVLGVVVMTSYGDKLLGHSKFAPIWDRLDALHAIVFIHPGELTIEPHFVGKLPQPIVDYPHGTTRTATDILYSGTLKAHPNVKVILSHAGGTLPFVGQRVAGVARLLQRDPKMDIKVTSADVEDGYKRFYYDVALSTGRIPLMSLIHFASHNHILFGSDFPYAPLLAGVPMTKQFEAFLETAEGRALKGASRENAEKLFAGKL